MPSILAEKDGSSINFFDALIISCFGSELAAVEPFDVLPLFEVLEFELVPDGLFAEFANSRIFEQPRTAKQRIASGSKNLFFIIL